VRDSHSFSKHVEQVAVEGRKPHPKPNPKKPKRNEADNRENMWRLCSQKNLTSILLKKPLRGLSSASNVRYASDSKAFEEWKKMAQKELKGESVDKLFWKTPEVHPRTHCSLFGLLVGFICLTNRFFPFFISSSIEGNHGFPSLHQRRFASQL
jgi:hypothetical protein